MFDSRKRKYDQNEIVDEKELFVIQQLAQLKSVSEVAKAYNAKFDGKKVTIPMVRYYKETRAPIIEQMRDKFISKTMYIPIANEKVRLRRTEGLYQESQKIEGVKDKVEVSLKCLKEAREEIKGESGSTQNFLQFNQYNELTDEQLLDKQKELEQKFIELSKKGESYALQEKG